MDESEVLKFEQQVRPMRLSEAIRIGAKIRQFQCRNGLYYGANSSCVIGAAYEAMTGERGNEFGNVPHEWFNAYATLGCTAYTVKYGYHPMSHNDKGVSREEIAHRLEALGY